MAAMHGTMATPTEKMSAGAPPATAACEYVSDNTLLARLTMSNVESSRDNLVAFGGRSFSICDDRGRIVFDSGNRLDAEAINRGVYDHSRSDNKGVEPECVALMHIEGRVLAFIGLERTLKSAIAICDVNDPADVRYMDMIASAGDKAPEGLTAFRAGGRHFRFSSIAAMIAPERSPSYTSTTQRCVPCGM
jgi:hypothetical protein